MSKGDAGHPSGPSGHDRLSRASANRLSLYLRQLQQLVQEGAQKVSSGQLGDALGITDAQVRKDLGHLGNLGHPGVGYHVNDLINALRQKLGIDRPWSAVVVGVGNLARALLGYRGFDQHGFRFVALFDAAREKVGTTINDMPILGMEQIGEKVRETGAQLALLAVPADSAQTAADALVAAGIRGILNFAPILLRVPPGISLVNVDLAVQLEQLAFHVHLNQTDPPADAK